MGPTRSSGPFRTLAAAEPVCAFERIGQVPAHISNAVRLRIEQEDGLDEDESDGTFRIVAKPSGVRDEATAMLSNADVRPNPVRDLGDLRWTQTQTGGARIRLYDLTGATVYESRVAIDAPGQQHVVLDLRSLSAGSYHYEIEAGRKSITGPIILQR